MSALVTSTSPSLIVSSLCTSSVSSSPAWRAFFGSYTRTRFGVPFATCLPSTNSVSGIMVVSLVTSLPVKTSNSLRSCSLISKFLSATSFARAAFAAILSCVAPRISETYILLASIFALLESAKSGSASNFARVSRSFLMRPFSILTSTAVLPASIASSNTGRPNIVGEPTPFSCICWVRTLAWALVSSATSLNLPNSNFLLVATSLTAVAACFTGLIAAKAANAGVAAIDVKSNTSIASIINPTALLAFSGRPKFLKG